MAAVVAVAGRRGAAVEILLAGEGLADQRASRSTWPSFSIRLPFAWRGNSACAMPGHGERIDAGR